MNINEMLQFITSILSYKTENKQIMTVCNNSNINWDQFVRVASQHLVLPAVYCRLNTRNILNILPNDLKLYLKEITEINRNRNFTLLQEAEKISTDFLSEGLNYVFLKGIAMIKGGYYEDIAERMIGDIDILIHPDDLTIAYTILLNNGYYPLKTMHGENYTEHRHLPRLLSNTRLGAVELHKKLLNNNYTLNFNSNLFLETKILIDDIPIPSIHNLLHHNVLNFQINDKAIVFGLFSIRNAYDTARILEKSEKNSCINLTNLFQKFIYHSYFNFFSKYFKIIHFKKEHLLISILTNFFFNKINHPKFNRVYIFSINSIRYSLILVFRLRLIIMNKNYRKDIFSQRPHIFYYFSKFFYQAKHKN